MLFRISRFLRLFGVLFKSRGHVNDFSALVLATILADNVLLFWCFAVSTQNKTLRL